MTVATQYQTGAWVDSPGPSARVRIRNDLPIDSPTSGEVLVRLECTGVCHSDVHSILGHTPMSTHIAGHEGIGRVVKVGPDVSTNLLNKRVGIKWIYSYCGQCEICEADVTYCPNQHNSGRDVTGTFQQYTISPVEPLTMIPESLDAKIAAPLLCAGVTIYSAIAKLDLKPGQWLVIPGAGGGLGHLGVQIAHRKGLKVIAIDAGDEKRNLCLNLGATHFLDFKTEDVVACVKTLTNTYGAHAVICLSSSRSGYESSLSMLRNTGTLVCIGLGKDELPISAFMMIVRGLKIVGSSVGTKEEMGELLAMAERGEVVPRVQVWEFERIGEVLDLVERNEVAGRAVVMLPE